MSNPINPSTDKVRQVYYPLSLKPSNDEEFPISYADNIWDVVGAGSTMAALAGNTGQYDQHTINELLANAITAISQALELIWHEINGQPVEHSDFSDDFSSDFN